jgi:hypothetical protein
MLAMRSAIRAGCVALAVVTVLLGAAYAWLKFSPRRVPMGQRPLATLSSDSLAEFKATFNVAEGNVRILALLSPT